MAGSPFTAPHPEGSSNPYTAFRSDSSSDQVYVLEAFNLWWATRTGSNSSRSGELEFCKEYCLAYPVLLKMAQVRQDLMYILGESGLLEAMNRVFKRFTDSPESKDSLMRFLNENSSRMKLAQALALISLYPNVAVSNGTKWNIATAGGASCRISNATCAGRNIKAAEEGQVAGFMFNRLIPSQRSATISEVTRASPLALALFFTPDTTARPHDHDEAYAPPFHTLHVNHQLYFGFLSAEAGKVTAYLKACLEMSIQWLFARLVDPSATHTMKEYTEEEVVRYIDNVIRTTISLLESDRF
jgi:hypothetical protein